MFNTIFIQISRILTDKNCGQPSPIKRNKLASRKNILAISTVTIFAFQSYLGIFPTYFSDVQETVNKSYLATSSTNVKVLAYAPFYNSIISAFFRSKVAVGLVIAGADPMHQRPGRVIFKTLKS